MRKAGILFIHALSGFALLSMSPARAQEECGDDPKYLCSSFSAPYARYYAPYALQAAAAYIDVNKFNNAFDPPAQIALAVGAYRTLRNRNVFPWAKEYLRAWRYQFGSTCRHADPDCWLGDTADRRTFNKSGPKFHVWARFPEKYGLGCSEVSIAFRGSTLSWQDWASNLNKVTRFLIDEHYQRLQRNIDALMNRITKLPCYQALGTRIVSVGHSLGGGLAQFAALAPPGPARIDAVFAFDSSPITGAPMVDQPRREENARGLEIHRVHQIGETLIPFRRWFQEYPPDTSPCVRTMSYEVLKPGWSVNLHDREGLAAGIVRVSYSAPGQYAFRLPPSLPGCNSRYPGPANDSDDYDTAKPPPPAPGVAMRSSTVGLSANQSDMGIRYASRDGFEFSASPELSAVPVKLERPARRTRR